MGLEFRVASWLRLAHNTYTHEGSDGPNTVPGLGLGFRVRNIELTAIMSPHTPNIALLTLPHTPTYTPETQLSLRKRRPRLRAADIPLKRPQTGNMKLINPCKTLRGLLGNVLRFRTPSALVKPCQT